MAINHKPEPEQKQAFDAHRLEMIRLMEAIDAQAGVVGNAEVTTAELRARQRARGIRAEDNLASRDLMRMRYGDDWDEE
jgi:hypothetical protein